MLRALLFILFTISFFACGNDDTSEIAQLREDIARLENVINEEITRLESLEIAQLREDITRLGTAINEDITRLESLEINQLREDVTRLEIAINEEITRLESLIGASLEAENSAFVDTSQIVFVYDGGIHIMDANGQHVKRIYDRPTSDARPKWSHDGEHIVFMSESMRDGFWYNDICVISADGSNPMPYTNRVSAETRNPVWTSQGEIVYENNHNYSEGLWLGFARIHEDAFQADYQTDGTLVFVKDLKTNKPERYQGIYTLNPLTEQETRLTFDSDSYPTWSPDGTQIAFVRRYRQSDIFVMNADGSFPRNLTQHPKDDTDPTWSPDGTHIAFVSDRETLVPHIWLMKASGTNLKKLHPGRAPDWK